MLRVGVDMIEISRIERALNRHGDRFYARFFTSQEREICNGRASRLAGRFAVKEAVGKALGRPPLESACSGTYESVQSLLMLLLRCACG